MVLFTAFLLGGSIFLPPQMSINVVLSILFAGIFVGIVIGITLVYGPVKRNEHGKMEWL